MNPVGSWQDNPALQCSISATDPKLPSTESQLLPPAAQLMELSLAAAL